jgi:hypothetical protein
MKHLMKFEYLPEQRGSRKQYWHAQIEQKRSRTSLGLLIWLEKDIGKVGGRLTLKLGSTLSEDDFLNLAIRLEEILNLWLSDAKGKVANED